MLTLPRHPPVPARINEFPGAKNNAKGEYEEQGTASVRETRGSEHIDTALVIQSRGFWYNARMRKNRFIGQDRCYHLISRLAHRAFFLDDEEKDRARR